MGAGRTLVVLSPHLDDAVFSVGAYMHRQARAGTRVRALTVFANDPAAQDPPGPWDVLCGFPSAAAAARARRDEDARACALVGAEPQWLAFADDSYGRSPDADDVWESLQRQVAGASMLLVPGFPLRHADHAWLTRLVVDRRAELSPALGFYAEQPYARAAFDRGARAAAPLPLGFMRVPTRATDRAAKVRAALQYRSQLRPLGGRILVRAFGEEWLRGGELVALPA
jgi:LmbE family N-acetylglucosaminyl deacetylase